MSVLSPHVFIMIHQGLLGTSLGLRSTLAESMVKKSGNVKSALRNMQFNQIGKLTPRFVAQESINVTAENFSLEGTVSSPTEPSVTF